MEIREYAERILFGDSLEAKFFDPGIPLHALSDSRPGPPRTWSTPGRPAELRIAPRDQRKRLPSPRALDDPQMRIRVLHTFANHELMAIELMAWALLAYPEAGRTFRLGMLNIIADEQRHLKLYKERIEALGAELGSEPVNDHFWRCAPSLTDPLKWVSAMNLTFEQANLDHAPVFEEHFARAGDEKSAAVMKIIAHDEIAHVAFGAHALAARTPKGMSTFETWVENLTEHNTPKRARGKAFNESARELAGLDPDFIERMRRAT